MFLRKQDGPRAVTMPDGSVMTRADLPAMSASTSLRVAIVVSPGVVIASAP